MMSHNSWFGLIYCAERDLISTRSWGEARWSEEMTQRICQVPGNQHLGVSLPVWNLAQYCQSLQQMQDRYMLTKNPCETNQNQENFKYRCGGIVRGWNSKQILTRWMYKQRTRETIVWTYLSQSTRFFNSGFCVHAQLKICTFIMHYKRESQICPHLVCAAVVSFIAQEITDRMTAVSICAWLTHATCLGPSVWLMFFN